MSDIHKTIEAVSKIESPTDSSDEDKKKEWLSISGHPNDYLITER
jgi:hypothetical protein